MVFNPDKYHRRSIRLRDYDYAQEGAYFVTICTRDRECPFGEVADGKMSLNHIGSIVRDAWFRSALIRREKFWTRSWSCPIIFTGLSSSR